MDLLIALLYFALVFINLFFKTPHPKTRRFFKVSLLAASMLVIAGLLFDGSYIVSGCENAEYKFLDRKAWEAIMLLFTFILGLPLFVSFLLALVELFAARKYFLILLILAIQTIFFAGFIILLLISSPCAFF
jgi:hypothetical protein